MKILRKIVGTLFIFAAIGGFIAKDFLPALIILSVGILLIKGISKNNKINNVDKETNIANEPKNIEDDKNNKQTNKVIAKKINFDSDKINNKNLKDFTIIDFETTGISVFSNEIIEIGAIKVRDLEVIDTFDTLCNPLMTIENTHIHGIKNDKVMEYKYPMVYMNDLLTFIGDDTIFAYNAPFDIEFLNSYLPSNINNKIVDVLALARARENRESYRLVDVREDLNINTECHRSIGDCEATLEYYKYLLFKYDIKRLQYTHVDSELTSLRSKRNAKYANYILENHIPDSSTFDEQSYFYNKNVCFSGDFDNFSKADAYLKILDIGGHVQQNVTLKTDILVIGTYKQKTSKEKKADEYNLRTNIKIEKLHEDDFLQLLNE
jgi:DNA polymerase-3 subunit epsilon